MSRFPHDEPDTSDNDHDHGDETDMIDAFLQGDVDWSVLVGEDDEAAYDGGDSGE
jgi:hypothetical protein